MAESALPDIDLHFPSLTASLPHHYTGYYPHPHHRTETTQMSSAHPNPVHCSPPALPWSVGSRGKQLNFFQFLSL